MEIVTGKHNDDIALALFSSDLERGLKFVDDKEDILAKEQVKPLNDLDKVREWIESRGLKRAAVTNAPRPNAKLMISLLGLSDFFHAVIIGGECEHAKPMHACTGPTHWKLAAFIKNPNHFVAVVIVVRISWASQ
ncbi:hypothetical protein Ahy_A03g011971 [Arachis hypogaea]|uniref:Haloacid dehalogenase-like hydrolase domain-containing protein n=1 Tax=Arachis hypogaea TaxID=3818 RepID=A0A445DS67_ARAHY|nr:hypothetical protein Ahy_A03g011971 [Arachis hypogaea]